MAKNDLKSALQKLDPSNDEHWTSDGSPAVKAVEQLLAGSTNRASIIEADPELTRDKAKERASSSEQASGQTTEQATEAEQAAAADHRPEGQPEVVAAAPTPGTEPITGEATPKEHADAATVAEGGHPAQITPSNPDVAPLDTTDVTGGGENRPAVGPGWDPGPRVTPQTSEGPSSGERPVVGTSYDAGERVPPQKADDSEPAVDQNPGPHVPPVQADGAIPETVDPNVFQPAAGTAPALQEAPLSIEPTKEDIAAASDVDFEQAQDELVQLDEELSDLHKDRDHIARRIQEVQARRDAIITSREVGTDSHVDATTAYFAAQDREKAEQSRLRAAQRELLSGLSPDVGTSQIDQAAAMAGKRGFGQARHAPRAPLASTKG